jgi:hypothetical protein
MKKETLQHHKKVALVCEERIFEVKVICDLSIPQSSKTLLAQKPQKK